MNSLFRSLVRLPARQAIRPAVLSTFTRSFSIKSIALNQQPTSTTSTTKLAGGAPNVSELPDLTHLKLANELYAVVRVHGNPFLVTEGDVMNLPYHLKTAEIGDVINFTDVTTIGSRNFTYSESSINPELYSIKAIVLEKTKVPMTIREVTKRRNRRVRHAISKQDKTRLRVIEIRLK